MSLWLCLHFDQLPLQCLNRCEEHAVVIIAKQRVLRANDCASALGIREGMDNNSVRTLAGEEVLKLLPRDEAAEQRCLGQLCDWAYCISPTIYTWREDCLLLEVGSCINLFNGLEALLSKALCGLRSRGFHAHYGLAATPKAAWLLSHFEPSQDIAAIARPLEQRLTLYPLSELKSIYPQVGSLQKAGLYTLGDILALPSHALARRCGKAFHQFLQQVLGLREDLHTNYQPPTTFSDEYWFGYEVKANEELLPAVQQLLQSMCLFLRNTQLTVVEIHWQLAGVDKSLQEICVRSNSSHSDWRKWHQLTRIHLERLELTSSVEGLSLLCHQLTSERLDNSDLFDNPHQQHESLAGLQDRLQSRLGLQAIEKIGCRDEHLPELALHICNNNPANQLLSSHCQQRPFWLMPEPRRLSERHQKLYWQGPIALLYGPERIEDYWWEQPISRDYYIAKGNNGLRYWVFRDRLAKEWYIHGVFA